MAGKRLFGTDGIRGEAGAYPLDSGTVRHLGMALAQVLKSDLGHCRVLVGRDTRESGAEIERSLAHGIRAGGGESVSAGILSTPAVAFLTRALGFDAGIVISASHNPYHDNGIKVFSREGFKLPDRLEHEVEELVLADSAAAPPEGPAIEVRSSGTDPELAGRYLDYLVATLPPGFAFRGLHLLLDCANGAATPLAPALFRRLGAEVEVISDAPNGRNINEACGALHAQALAEQVRRRGAQLGAAYDGDADRCILVDETGIVRDGDDFLAVAATAMQSGGHLGSGGVVLTVMANLGLENYLDKLGVDLVRAPVGDKYVLEEMRRRGARLGGEQSGHIIFLEHATTGDGILSSLLLAEIMTRESAPLSALASCWTRLPQVLRNVRVRSRVDLRSVPAIAAALDRVEAAMAGPAGRGRLLVRYSGTEPVVRIMLEGESMAEIEGHATAIADTITASLR